MRGGGFGGGDGGGDGGGGRAVAMEAAVWVAGRAMEAVGTVAAGRGGGGEGADRVAGSVVVVTRWRQGRRRCRWWW